MDPAALKAAGFSDQEIRLHQAGFSDDEIKAASAGTTVDPVTVTAPKKPATFMSTLGRAAWNLPADTLDTLKGIAQLPGEAAHAVMHPVETAHGLGGVAENAAHILSGGLQHIRELSPADNRGSAPAMDTTAYDKLSNDNYDKYGTKANIYKTVGDHPLGAAIAAGSVVMPALKAVGITDALAGAGAGAAAKVGEAADALPVVKATRKVANAGTTSQNAADVMKLHTRVALEDDGAAAAEAATQNTFKEDRTRAVADKLAARGKKLDARRAAAVKEAAPPELDIGEPAQLTDQGSAVRAPAKANEAAINAKMREADTQYRAAMEQVTAEQAAKGVGVSDTPSAKALIDKSKAVVKPDPVNRPSVGNVPADSAGAKLHQELLDVLHPQIVSLSEDQAYQLVKRGEEVLEDAQGNPYRVVKPSFENVDDFRRKLGQIRNGEIEGYPAINRIQAGKMYRDVASVLDEYVGGTSKAVQDNWRAGKEALAPYENVRAGRAIVGTQAGTAQAAVPAANIPGRILAGGRDTVAQAKAVAGDAPVSAMLRSQAQNALAGAKTADAADALVRPGGMLADVVSGEPDLAVAVQDYIQRMRNAESAGASAKDLGSRAATQYSRADVLNKAADTLNGNSMKAMEAARDTQRQLARLDIAAPQDVGKLYSEMLDRRLQANAISVEQYKQGLALAQSAEKAFATKASRDMWLKRAAVYSGASALGLSGASLLGKAFH